MRSIRSCANGMPSVAPTAAARRSGVEGTGLGLSIGRQILEAHHGKIHVAETPGGGTTFSIVLPLAERPAVESEPREAV